jgi:hypothetical protein
MRPPVLAVRGRTAGPPPPSTPPPSVRMCVCARPRATHAHNVAHRCYACTQCGAPQERRTRCDPSATAAPTFMAVYEYRLPRYHVNHVCNSEADLKRIPGFYGPAGVFFMDMVRRVVCPIPCAPPLPPPLRCARAAPWECLLLARAVSRGAGAAGAASRLTLLHAGPCHPADKGRRGPTGGS